MNKNIVIVILLLVIISGGTFFSLKEKKSQIADLALKPIVTETQPPQEKETPSTGVTVAAPKLKKKEIHVYAEPDNDSERSLVGAQGEQVRLVASTNFPATVTYKYMYSSAVVYPGAVASETSSGSITKSVNPGKTVLEVFNAIDGKVDVEFTYVDNTGKSPSSITPPVGIDLYIGATVQNPKPGAAVEYALVARATTTAVINYTVTYTPPSASKSVTITKTTEIKPDSWMKPIDWIISTTEPQLISYTLN
jgi:hypothetical protein